MSCVNEAALQTELIYVFAWILQFTIPLSYACEFVLEFSLWKRCISCNAAMLCSFFQVVIFALSPTNEDRYIRFTVFLNLCQRLKLHMTLIPHSQSEYRVKWMKNWKCNCVCLIVWDMQWNVLWKQRIFNKISNNFHIIADHYHFIFFNWRFFSICLFDFNRSTSWNGSWCSGFVHSTE